MKSPQETSASSTAHGRWYSDACGTAFGLEVLGERWALLIVRELLWGPKRFSDLRTGLPGISAKVLTERLEGLARWGVLSRRVLPPPASAQVYELTEWGRMAEPVIMELGRWAARSVKHDPTLPLSTASLMSSMKTMQSPALEEAKDTIIGMAIGSESYRVAIRDGSLEMTPGPLEGCDAVLRAASAPPIAGALYSGQPFEAMEAAGALSVEGDRTVLASFLTLFALPEKVDGEAVTA